MSQWLDHSLPVAALAYSELKMGMRRSALRVLVVVALLVGWSAGGQPGAGAAVSAYSAGNAACLYLGFAAVVWMALVATRDTALGIFAIVYSKPQPGERLALARFLGGYIQILIVLAALVIGAMAGRLWTVHSFAGFAAYPVQFGRAALALLFLSGASWCLSLLTNSPVAGALVGLYWIVTQAGKEFLGKAFFASYSQNQPAYTLLGLGLVGLTCWWYLPRRRGSARPALWCIVLALVGSTWGAAWLYRIWSTDHDPNAHPDRLMEMVTRQYAAPGGKAPGFLLTDANGKQGGLADYPGKVLVVALWSPASGETGKMFEKLGALHRKYAASGVLPVAICINEDASAARTFALGDRAGFPVFWDWGSHNAPKSAEMSPLAAAYQATDLPFVVVTNRRRCIQVTLNGARAYEGAELETAIQAVLAEDAP